MTSSGSQEFVFPGSHNSILTPESSPQSSQENQRRNQSVRTLVFFHCKSTGLPQKFKGSLKITRNRLEFSRELKNRVSQINIEQFPPMTELSLVAVPVETFCTGARSMREKLCLHPDDSIEIPLHTSKITLQFNHKVTEEQSQESWRVLGEERARYASETFDSDLRATFREQWNLIYSFLNTLPKPACLISHSGLTYGFIMLYGELKRNNLLTQNTFPPQLSFVDASYLFLHSDKKYKNNIDKILQTEKFLSLDPPKHPWLYLKDEDAPTAVLRRFGPELFKKNDNEPWIFEADVDSFGYRLSDLYEKLIGGHRNFTFAEENCLALLQNSLAYGQDFLSFMNEIAAPLHI